MDQEKKIKVNSTSLVDLKAELLRKQDAFQKEKAQHGNKVTGRRPVFKRESVWNKKNKGVLERASQDMEQKMEEENVLDKSRKVLEAKAKLYEKLANSAEITEEDGSQRFLVDFQRKAIDNILVQRLQERQKKEETDKEKMMEEKKEIEMKKEEEEIIEGNGVSQLTENYPASSQPDSFGEEDEYSLTRKELGQDTGKSLFSGDRDLMSADMHREKMREKWELEQQEALNKPTGPIHYANVQFDEIRNHGVGFYQFSKEDEVRQEQMGALSDLRQQTIKHRARTERLKEKRKALMDARLAKVKQRRMIHQELDNDEDEDLIGPQPDKSVEATIKLLERDDSWRKKAPLREWDEGKKDVFIGAENWLEKQREERPSEFAPPSLYDDTKPSGRQAQGQSGMIPGHQTKVSRFKEQASFHKEQPSKIYSGSSETYDTVQQISLGLKVLRAQSQKISTEETNVKVKDSVSSIPSAEEQISLGLTAFRARSGISRKEELTNVDVADTSSRIANIPLPPEPSETLPGGAYNTLPQTDVIQLPHMESNIPQYRTDITQYPNVAGSDVPVEHQFFSSPDYNIPGTAAHYGFNTQPGITNYEQLPNVPTAVEESNNANITLDVQNTVQAPPVLVQQAPQDVPIEQPTALAAPQPAHYCSAPMKPQPKVPKYQPVHMHKLPPSLPAPPSSQNIPLYPSQEVIHGAKKGKEDAQIKYWMKQYNYKGGEGNAHLRPANIPFPSPYVQKKEGTPEPFEKVEFDPSKPPPSIKK